MLDTNRSYCDRLAQEIFPTVLGNADFRRLLERRFRETCAPPTPCMDDEVCMSAQLQVRPDLQSHLAGLTGYTPSKWLLERELEAAQLWPPTDPKASRDAYEVARARDAAGLCFSGGGIRSATFNLGIAQGLARNHRLCRMQYLSSVSGGGYIHQFLANWIFKTGSGTRVEQMLDPIPNAPDGDIDNRSTISPEPIRWLRRYSNYLAPRKGMFSLDSWTIGAVWARNTGLNLLVVLSTLSVVLLLPHAGTILTDPLREHASISSLMSYAAAVGYIVLASFFYRWLKQIGPPTPTATQADATSAKADPKVRKDPPPAAVKGAAVCLFIASSVIAPSVYRSTVPGGNNHNPEARRVYARAAKSPDVHYQTVYNRDHGTAEHVEVTLDSHDPETEARVSLADRPQTLVGDIRAGIKPKRSLLAFFFLCALFVTALCAATEVGWKGAPLFFLVGAVFAYAMLEGIRLVFFVAGFFVSLEHLPALGVVMLPSLLFGVPYVSVELGLGLLGRASTSHQREWLARIRAFSFLFGSIWLALTACSLLGPAIFDSIASYTKTSYTVWFGWLATSVGGVLSANSAKTSNGRAARTDSPSLGSSAMELLAKVAPPVFVSGLLILLAKFVDLLFESIRTHHPPAGEHPWGAFAILLLVNVAVAGLFGWRVDINDFSMHSFYRDRLARAYAGASTPNRTPNRFTGFAPADSALRVDELLPVGQVLRDADGSVIQTGTYEGPMPIICTAINLTTGEDLAYQERKAASFAFTPIFSGFNVGWTNAVDDRNQFNGFVYTREYVYTHHNRLMLSTAVAISGAAASPNMGYHTNPAIAFLLTIFNVRLGWWLRNPRRRMIGLTSDKPTPAEPKSKGAEREPPAAGSHRPKMQGTLPSSPRWGLLSLIKELMGLSDDTTSYVYLTDGGHFDNMGLYELLRRRCRRIIVCDGEADCGLSFEGIGMAIRKARLDFGVEVVLDRTAPVPSKEEENRLKGTPSAPPAAAPLPYTLNARVTQTDPVQLTGTLSRHKPPAPTVEGLSSFEDFPANSIHAVHGTIRYPEDSSPDQFGHILYIKASLTGDEPADVLNYRRQHDKFPHDTTLNQFFTESQFESYRRLGEHISLNDETVRSWLQRYLPVAKEAPPTPP